MWINKNAEEITKNICYILQFIDSATFMERSLSNLVNETCRIEYKYCNCFFEYTNFKDYLIEYKCSCCNKIFQQKFDEKLKERF